MAAYSAVNQGHNHPRIVAAIERTLKSLMHASNTMLNVPRLKLHEKLGKLLPKPRKPEVGKSLTGIPPLSAAAVLP